jgi:hypothetical protein
VRIGSVDVTKTSLNETVKGAQFGDQGIPLSEALKQAVKVRIIEGFSSEAAKGVTMFGLTMDEGAAILGEADVKPDGSWLADIPPYVPVHLQPIDKFGLSIRNQRLWIQGQPGEDRRCIGCHEQRSGIGAPSRGANPTAAEQAVQQFLAPVLDRKELPWALSAAYAQQQNPQNPQEPPVPVTEPKILIQKILDAKCVQCHNGGTSDPFAGQSYQMTATVPGNGTAQTFTIPYLDLSSAEITVVYDRMAATYPKSYVSLFFPATMEMGMGNTQRTGSTPPLWAIPNNARESAMIKKLNVKAPDGQMAYAGAMHPEDKGVELTAEERLILIQSIDVGGQFYARQNTGFVPFANDPTATGRKY